MSVYSEIQKVLIFYDYLIDTNINLCLSQLAIPHIQYHIPYAEKS